MRILASVALLIACSTPARVPSSTAPRRSLELQPVHVWGGEGRHSASHTSSNITGALTLDATSATLALAVATSTSHVRCPASWKDGTTRTVQACASDDAKDSTTTRTLVLRGAMRTEGAAIAGELREGELHIGLSCTPTARGYHCAITSDSHELFGPPHQPYSATVTDLEFSR